MSEIQREDIWFDSSNGTSRVAGFFYTCPSVPPRAVVQLSHGMCEYIGRYEEVAGYLARNGYAVAGNDHLGHGDTAAGEYGYFGPDGARHILHDLHTMNQLARKRFPGLPVILLGHSMGSFFARLFAATYPDAIDALIISGTAGPNPALMGGILLSRMLARTKGEKYRSNVIQKMAFGSYLARIPHPNTPYDWITRDEEIVAAYAKDPRCTFIFTVNAFYEMFRTLRAVSSERWAQRLKKTTPVLMFSGDQDPVGSYGKGVCTVERMLRAAGVQDLTLLLYPGGRHEMLNEINRQDVYADLLAWLDHRFKH